MKNSCVESDPNGKSQHELGAKMDEGKIRPSLVLGGFAKALWVVCSVGTSGAIKYTPRGWLSVPNGIERYEDALMRHWLKYSSGEWLDEDSGLPHLGHIAWNVLAILELKIIEGKRNERLQQD